MKINLGYVALPMTLDVTSSHTMTYTRYQMLGPELGNAQLHKIILSNFDALEKILYYNYKNKIHFYRLTSNLIPLATHPEVHYDFYEQYKERYQRLGKLIRDYQIRVDFHPDQYCVINSIHNDVVEASVRLLNHHVKMMELMGIEMKLVLHMGGGTYGKRAGMNRFMKVFRSLDPKVQSKIVLENDDKLYHAEDVLEVCRMLEIPMVLDYHHHLCNPSETSITMLLPKIYETWKKENLPPKMHFSSPASRRDFRNHHDYIEPGHFINFIELLKQYETDVDLMIEAKKKDEALFRLVRQLRFNDYILEGTTLFL